MALTPILLTDVINPVLLTFLIYAAGTNRPVVNSSALLLGHTAAYFAAGILVALGLEQISDRLANPKTIDFVVQLAAGLLLLWLALRPRKDTGKKPDEDQTELTVGTALGLGAIINVAGVPFAIPYFAAVGQILKADLSNTTAIVVLLAYNLLYALPFSIVPILRAVLGESSRPLLERINSFVTRSSRIVMPVMLVLIGLALVADGFLYLVTGAALF